MSPIDLALIALYILGVTLFGAYVGASSKGLRGYFLGGRRRAGAGRHDLDRRHRDEHRHLPERAEPLLPRGGRLHLPATGDRLHPGPDRRRRRPAAELLQGPDHVGLRGAVDAFRRRDQDGRLGPLPRQPDPRRRPPAVPGRRGPPRVAGTRRRRRRGAGPRPPRVVDAAGDRADGRLDDRLHLPGRHEGRRLDRRDAVRRLHARGLRGARDHGRPDRRRVRRPPRLRPRRTASSDSSTRNST